MAGRKRAPPERKRLNCGEYTGRPSLSFLFSLAAASAACRGVSNVPMGSHFLFEGLYSRACHFFLDLITP